jgi:hypothetical protein
MGVARCFPFVCGTLLPARGISGSSKSIMMHELFRSINGLSRPRSLSVLGGSYVLVWANSLVAYKPVNMVVNNGKRHDRLFLNL